MVSRFPLPALFLALFASLCDPSAGAQSRSLDYINSILGQTDAELAKSGQRLSGGRVVLTDDPASYAIYDSLAAQLRELAAAVRNGADMLSYYRYEESMLGDLTDLAQRIRELLLQGSDAILDDGDRGIIDAEIGQYVSQISQTMQQAEFNQKKLFPPAASSMIRKSGYLDWTSVEKLLAYLISERTAIGAKTNALEFTLSGQEIQGLNTGSALSQGDTDFSAGIINLQRNYVRLAVNLLMLR